MHHPETRSFIGEQTTSVTLESIVTNKTKKKKKDEADENKLQQLIHTNKANRKNINAQ